MLKLQYLIFHADKKKSLMLSVLERTIYRRMDYEDKFGLKKSGGKEVYFL